MKFYVILMVLMLPTSGHAMCVCPKGWSAYGRHCYLYTSQPTYFHNAEAICAGKSLNGRQSHLASIMDAGEADFVAEISTTEAPSYFWIGLKGWYYTWQWTDGQPYTFTSWGAGYPTSSYETSENCILMYPAVPGRYWINYVCSSSTYPYVCKMLQRYQYRPSA